MPGKTLFLAKIENIPPRSIISGAGGVAEGGNRNAAGMSVNIKNNLSFELKEGSGRVIIDFPNYRKNHLEFKLSELLLSDEYIKSQPKIYHRFLYTLKLSLQEEANNLGWARFNHKYLRNDLEFVSQSFLEINEIKSEGPLSVALVELLNVCVDCDTNIPEFEKSRASELAKLLHSAARRIRPDHSGHDGVPTAIGGLLTSFTYGGIPAATTSVNDQDILNQLGVVIVKLPEIETTDYMEAYNKQKQENPIVSKEIMDRNSEISKELVDALNQGSILEFLNLAAESTKNHITYMQGAESNPIDLSYQDLISQLKEKGISLCFVGAPGGDNAVCFYDKNELNEEQVHNEIQNIIDLVFVNHENKHEFAITDLKSISYKPYINIEVNNLAPFKRKEGEQEKESVREFKLSKLLPR